MKARVKATGTIVNVEPCRGKYLTRENQWYSKEQLVFSFEEDFEYWEKLKHQYAGMAMQGLMSYVEQITPNKGRSFCDEIVDISFKVAHALVQKLKNE